MLKGIDPLLTGNLLKILCDMGHGDEIVVADANFPAERCGKRVIRLPGTTATEVLCAILPLFPLDTYSKPAVIMERTKEDQAKGPEPEIWSEMQQVLNVPLDRIGRMDFYDRASKAFAVIQTGEKRIYGNVILVKGVI